MPEQGPAQKPYASDNRKPYELYGSGIQYVGCPQTELKYMGRGQMTLADTGIEL
jgi:hypothetical protein